MSWQRKADIAGVVLAVVILLGMFSALMPDDQPGWFAVWVLCTLAATGLGPYFGFALGRARRGRR